MPKHLYVCKVRVAPKHHALFEVFGGNGFFGNFIKHRATIFIQELLAIVSVIKIQLAVGAKHKSVHSVVMLHPTDPRKNDLFFISLVIPVFVGQNKNTRALRHNYAVAQNTNAEWGIEVFVLVKHLAHVGLAVAVGVFQNHNAVALGFGFIARNGGSVVVGFANPNAASGIHVDVGGVPNHGFGRKQSCLQTIGHRECTHGIFRVTSGGIG